MYANRNALPRRRRRAGVSQLDPRQRDARPSRRRRIRRCAPGRRAPRQVRHRPAHSRRQHDRRAARLAVHGARARECRHCARRPHRGGARGAPCLPRGAQPVGVRACRRRARAATAVDTRPEAGGGVERQRRAAARVRPPRADAVLRLHLRFVYRGRGEAGSALLPDCPRALRLGRRLDDARRGPLLRGRGGRPRQRPAGDADRSLRPV